MKQWPVPHNAVWRLAYARAFRPYILGARQSFGRDLLIVIVESSSHVMQNHAGIELFL